MQSDSQTLRLTRLSLLVAIILLMKLTGLSSIPIGPLNMTFTMVPIAIGAMLMGPIEGAILGIIYGLTSFYDAATASSAMTGFFFQLSPLHTFILCVGMRAAVGAVSGLLFRIFQRVDRTNTVCYYLGGLATPLLNTAFFMGYMILVFYRTDYVQSRVHTLGAGNPLQFLILSVGVQGLIEAASGMLIGGSVAKAISAALKYRKSQPNRSNVC